MASFEVNIAFNVVGPVEDRNLPFIIFLHEISFSKESWEPCLRSIANGTGRKVITYDARNHGDSGWTENFSYDFMMADLKSVMDYFSIPKAVLVGHGMGGKTAIEFALKFPEKVEKIVVEEMTLRFQPEGERGFCLKYMDVLKESLQHIPADVKDLEAAKKFLASYISARIPENYKSDHPQELTPEMMRLEIDPLTGKFEWRMYLRLLEYAVLNGFQLEPDVGGFRVFKYQGEYNGPALFLYGTKSPYSIINDQDFIVDRLKNATFKAVEGGGHLLHTDLSEKFCGEVIEFINTA